MKAISFCSQLREWKSAGLKLNSKTKCVQAVRAVNNENHFQEYISATL